MLKWLQDRLFKNAAISTVLDNKASRDRRRQRQSLSTAVTVMSHQQAFTCLSKNISRGGIGLQTTCPPPVDSAVTLYVSLSNRNEEELKGYIRHHHSNNGAVVGCGVQFAMLSPETSWTLDDLMYSLNQRLVGVHEVRASPGR